MGVYKDWSGALEKKLLSYAQWKYLEELRNNDGMFGGRRFSRALFNRLSSSGEWALGLYRRFYLLRDSMPEMKKLKLPSEYSLEDIVGKLEMVFDSRSNNAKLDAGIRSRKKHLNLDYEDENFKVIVPETSYEIMVTAQSCSWFSWFIGNYAASTVVPSGKIIFMLFPSRASRIAS